jgi:hypothetical protein
MLLPVGVIVALFKKNEAVSFLANAFESLFHLVSELKVLFYLLLTVAP